jgi:hypothetical protein
VGAQAQPPDVVHAVGRPVASLPGWWNYLVRGPGKVLAPAEVSYAWRKRAGRDVLSGPIGWLDQEPGSVGSPDRDVTLEATPDIAAGQTIQGLVAQRSEQGTHNPSVVGSIPTEPTERLSPFSFGPAERSHTKWCATTIGPNRCPIRANRPPVRRRRLLPPDRRGRGWPWRSPHPLPIGWPR